MTFCNRFVMFAIDLRQEMVAILNFLHHFSCGNRK